MKIATMEFIRYHRTVRDYLMGKTEVEPEEHPVWTQAAAFVEPEMDYVRGYISHAECIARQDALMDQLYPNGLPKFKEFVEAQKAEKQRQEQMLKELNERLNTLRSEFKELNERLNTLRSEFKGDAP